ncbi:MAG: ribonuclease R [Gemmatimonadetes bacterium]|nr:ribonuclease R [Gemmatimonadota bacterium]
MIRKALRRGGPGKPKELARRLGIPRAAYPAFRDRLKALVESGELARKRGGRITLPSESKRRSGLLTVTRGGHGFVRLEGGGGEVFVPPEALGGALPGDRVSVEITAYPPGKSPVGEVTDILDAGPTVLSGRYEAAGEVGFVIPFDPRFRRDLLVPRDASGEAKHGDMVVAEITHRGNRRHGPVGQVTDVLGPAGDPSVQSLAVARGRGFDIGFSEEVVRAAEALADAPLGEREDRTEEAVVTIDPGDARDHDDAISVEPTEEGFTVGVHIADVAHYVAADGPIDREARKRGTSVYLVDRVIPMLPEALSTDLCSLVPDKVRPAVSVYLDVKADGRVVGTRFARTAIRNRRKLSYEDAQAIIDRGTSVSAEIDQLVRSAAQISRALRARRLSRGALNLEFPEPRILLDESGAPVDSIEQPHLESHSVIEELMLAANEAVARACLRAKAPSPYRIHDPPSGDSLDQALGLLRGMGYAVPDDPRPADFQRALTQSKDTPQQALVAWTVLRALKRACYAPAASLHFGLATSEYTHFTSPIRRYPDLLVHRTLLAKVMGVGQKAVPDGEELAAICTEASEREREAEAAERDSVLLCQVEIMSHHVGEVFDGRVTGVTGFGAFIRLERPFVEGLLHVSQVGDDYLDFDPARMELVGRRTGMRLFLGQELQVQVSRVDREERRIEFSLPDEGGRTGRRGGRGGRGRPGW